MKKVFIIGIIAVVGIVIILLYGADKNNTSQTNATIKIAASFYPLAEFAKQVGGERVEIVNITPVGAEPHNFEPTPQDVAAIFSSKVFIFNGAGFDPWAEKLKLDLEQKGVITLNMSEYFDLISFEEEHEDEETEDSDPHIWLDPVFAKKEIEIIRDTLTRVDPSNDSEYTNNAAHYIDELELLDEKYKDGLASCEIRYVVASHAAFGYLAKRYNIDIFSIAGISPEEEPSPKKMAGIVQLAKQKNIKYIFFETLVSPKLSETIAQEIGAEMLVFNPFEALANKKIATRENYLSVMEKNLANLRKALICR